MHLLHKKDILHSGSVLLRKLIEGNELAMKELFRIYHARLLYFVSHFIKSEKIAEEVVMDVFMKIWTSRDSLTDVKNFDSFLFKIARNKSIDFLRSAAADRRLSMLLWDEIQKAAPEAADERLLAKEYEEKLEEAVLHLPPKCKKVYSLSREYQLSHEQIASELNISSATVNNHIVKAQRFLRDYLSRTMNLYVFILIGKLITIFFER